MVKANYLLLVSWLFCPFIAFPTAIFKGIVKRIVLNLGGTRKIFFILSMKTNLHDAVCIVK